MKVSKKAGAETPFKRPKHLSNDYASDFPVIEHCINYLNSKKYNFDYVCSVYPVNPFLEINDLKKGLAKIKNQKTGFVFSAVKYQFPFFRSFVISKKKIKMIFKNITTKISGFETNILRCRPILLGWQKCLRRKKCSFLKIQILWKYLNGDITI